MQPRGLYSTLNLVSADVWTWSDVICLIRHLGIERCFLLQVTVPWNNHKWLFPSNNEERFMLHSNFLSSSTNNWKKHQQSVEINPNFWVMISILCSSDSVPSIRDLWKEIHFNKNTVKQIFAIQISMDIYYSNSE